MRYYAVADVHGFYEPLISALENAGFFQDTEPKKLIVCGDVIDRGDELERLVDFLLELKARDELVYIKGNHEDLLIQIVSDLECEYVEDIAIGSSHHVRNGTWDTALLLGGMSEAMGLTNPRRLASRIMKSKFVTELLPFAVNYYEVENFIFTHGWLPSLCSMGDTSYRYYKYFAFNPNWRVASEQDWENARWYNGMEFACERRIFEEGKTVVCGHYHTSYGHSNIDGKGSEYGDDADFTPFFAKGIIAIDGFTAVSGIVNVAVLDL